MHVDEKIPSAQLTRLFLWCFQNQLCACTDVTTFMHSLTNIYVLLCVIRVNDLLDLHLQAVLQRTQSCSIVQNI